jgi:hypothetical protein
MCCQTAAHWSTWRTGSGAVPLVKPNQSDTGEQTQDRHTGGARRVTGDRVVWCVSGCVIKWLVSARNLAPAAMQWTALL